MVRSGNQGGTSDKALAAAAQRLAIVPDRRLPNLVIPAGDSRSDANFLDPSQLTYGARSPLNHAKARLEQRFIIGRGMGKSGDRTDNVLLAAIDGTRDPRRTNAGLVHLHVGVNDIAQTASTGNFTFKDVVSQKTISIDNVAENAFSNIKEYCRLMNAAGITVVVENEVGANGLSTVEKVAALMELRQMIAEYGEVTPMVHLHDAFDILAVPTFDAGKIQLRANLTYDETHMNGAGAYLWGKSLAELLDRIIPPARKSLPIKNIAENTNRRQLLTNPLFATPGRGTASTGFNSGTFTANTTSGSSSLVATSGRVWPNGTQVTGAGIPANTFINQTGTAGTYAMVNAAGAAVNATASATGVTITSAIVPLGFMAGVIGSATALIDVVAGANGMGNDVVIGATFAAKGDAVRFRQDLNGSSANGGTYNAALRPGDIVQGVAVVEVTTAPVNLAALYLSVAQNSGTGSASITSFDLFSANDDRDYGIPEACRLWLATKPFTLPAPVGTFPYIITEMRAVARAAGSCNFTVKQMGLKRRNTLY